MAKRMWTHEGVYAAIVNMMDGRPCLLTVRKIRGPYTGLLDLPGGSPEPGENRETTLQHELDEEIGATASISARGGGLSFALIVTRRASPSTFITAVGGVAPTSLASHGHREIHDDHVKTLTEEDRVEFEIQDGPWGPAAVNVVLINDAESD